MDLKRNFLSLLKLLSIILIMVGLLVISSGFKGVNTVNAQFAYTGTLTMIPTTIPPGEFDKINPPNGSTGLSTSLTLTWGWSMAAAGYEYCYDTTDDNSCSNWVSNGTSRTKTLSGLSIGTTYYWQVRASNVLETVYANGSPTAFWSFTVGDFNKISPANGSSGHSTDLTLIWESSNDVTDYEFCYDTTNDNSCSNWISNGLNTSRTLSGLSTETKYYWQVRATKDSSTIYADGSSTAFWSFTVGYIPPGAFNKFSPANGSTVLSTYTNIYWESSNNANSYEYCYDTTNDNSCSDWISNGTNTSKTLVGLSRGTTYYWQVRATNELDTVYANGSPTAFWSFTVGYIPPGAFNKYSPANGSTGLSTDLVLIWNYSDGATDYEYCYDTTNDNSCSDWISNGAYTGTFLSGLSNGTTYYWQVRASNELDTVYANGSPTAFWSFTVRPSPLGTFNKISPPNNSIGQSTNPVLSWESSERATDYEYCYDTTNDNSCSNWVSNGNNTSKTLSGLSKNTTYYWQIRATNESGTAYANGNLVAIWSFTTHNGTGLDCDQVSFDGIILYENKFCNKIENGKIQSFSQATKIIDVEAAINNAASSIFVGEGWSLKVFENLGGGGSWRCITGSLEDLGAEFYTHINLSQIFQEARIIEDTISSVKVYKNGDCRERRVIKSQAAYDGWIIESGENTNEGNVFNSSDDTFYLGDNAVNKQYRSILSFITSGLPDNAVIVKVTLKIRVHGLWGANPFNTHGGLKLDIIKGIFGSSAYLESNDFQWKASKRAVGTFSKAPKNNWYHANLGSSAFQYINLTGITQFRLRFARDDNDDKGADCLKFFSGNAALWARPQLIIEYYVP